MEFAIPAHLAQAVVDYLTKQPYRDVAMLLQSMQALRPISQRPEPAPAEPAEAE